MKEPPRRVGWLAADLLIAALGILVLFIAVTGGGVLSLRGHSISMRSVDNPLVALVILGGLRWWLGPTQGFLGNRAWTRERLEQASASLIARTGATISARPRLAIRVVLAATLLSLSIKIAIAVAHPGFFSGDDVEIHEMSLGRLLGTGWPAWELRSAFYPMVFVYPVQAAAHAAGVTDVEWLVIAGRVTVATLSSLTVWLLFVVARRHIGSTVAVAAALLLAYSHLYVTFGATELPRPVCALFVLAGFAGVMRGSGSGALVGGILVGVAAAMRFSEIVFVVPGVMHLLLDRRVGHAGIFAGALLGTAGAIQAASDLLYWGSPFFSARRMFDYTVVSGQSSRGFEPVWAYLTGIPDWSDLVIVGLALLATVRGATRVALWAWLPVALLSALPHKEARYLVPVMPFVALLAALGATSLAAGAGRSIQARALSPSGRTALLLIAGLAVSVVLNVSRYHVRRDDAAVGTARMLSQENPRGLAAEQLWRLGGRLYLRGVPAIRELSGADLTAAGLSASAAQPEIGWVLVRRETCERIECGAVLSSAGFVERPDVAAGSGYRVFSRPNAARAS